MNNRFFENPEFCAYISLLRELHRLIKAGDGETAQADELRDRMDGPSSKLDQEEIAVVNGISGEFYKLMENGNDSTLPCDHHTPEQLESAVESALTKYRRQIGDHWSWEWAISETDAEAFAEDVLRALKKSET